MMRGVKYTKMAETMTMAESMKTSDISHQRMVFFIIDGAQRLLERRTKHKERF